VVSRVVRKEVQSARLWAIITALVYGEPLP